MNRIIGAILFLVGLLMTMLFPDIPRYQSAGFRRDEFGYAGVIIGIILIVVGIYLMKT